MYLKKINNEKSKIKYTQQTLEMIYISPIKTFCYKKNS